MEPNNADLALEQFSPGAGDEFQTFVVQITSEAQALLVNACEEIRAGADPAQALTTVYQHINYIQQIAGSSGPIINGLAEALRVTAEQRNDLVYQGQAIHKSLDPIIPRLLEVAADPTSGDVRDVLLDYAASSEVAAAIIDDHEISLNEEVQGLILTLTDEGLIQQAAELEQQFGVTAQARDSLGDLIGKYTKLLNDRTDEALADVEPMTFDQGDDE